jgi:hypothetical protein
MRPPPRPGSGISIEKSAHRHNENSREKLRLNTGTLSGQGAATILSGSQSMRCDKRRMATSDVELARRGFDAVLNGDLDAIRDFLDPDVSWHGGDPSADGSCHGREQALSSCAAHAAADASAS